ncbi:hypothetical protein Avbf_14966 [Armadillidium vulgare]|nr:hypothetical protein Avbf_14966 [Armadillidium vulgare]
MNGDFLPSVQFLKMKAIDEEAFLLLTPEYVFNVEYPEECRNVWTSFKEESTTSVLVTVYYKFVINCKMHYKCAYCKKGFIKVNLLMKHLDLHNNINKYRCIQGGCCREFRHKFSFLRHIKSHKFACEKKAFCNSHSMSKIRNDKNSDSSSSSTIFKILRILNFFQI